MDKRSYKTTNVCNADAIRILHYSFTYNGASRVRVPSRSMSAGRMQRTPGWLPEWHLREFVHLREFCIPTSVVYTYVILFTYVIVHTYGSTVYTCTVLECSTTAVVDVGKENSGVWQDLKSCSTDSTAGRILSHSTVTSELFFAHGNQQQLMHTLTCIEELYLNHNDS